jgi:hypothetical protein
MAELSGGRLLAVEGALEQGDQGVIYDSNRDRVS